MKDKYERVEVRWIDSHGSDSWEPVDNATQSLREALWEPCMSIGYIVDETKKSITLAQTQHGDVADNYIIIPKVAVMEIRYARVGTKRS